MITKDSKFKLSILTFSSFASTSTMALFAASKWLVTERIADLGVSMRVEFFTARIKFNNRVA